MTTDNRRSHGFSLLEVLITVVVLSVALLALAKFQGDSLKEGSIAKKRTEAANLAQQQIEILRNFSTPAQFRALATGSNEINGQTDTFTRTWAITADTNTNNPDLRMLTVRVRWPSADGTLPADDDNVAETKVILTSVISLADPAMIARAAAGPAAPAAAAGPAAPAAATTTTTTAASSTTTAPGTTTTTNKSGTTTTSAAPTTTTSTTTFRAYKCTCTWQNDQQGTKEVVADPSGCNSCTIKACDTAKPAGIKNGEKFTIACP